jgi:hypothetical protein
MNVREWKEITVTMNERGQGGELEVDANPMEEVDSERAYRLAIKPPTKLWIYLK